MNEYILSPDDELIGYNFDRETHELAIAKAEDYADLMRICGKVWKLYMIERSEYPELHDAVDNISGHHRVFVTEFTFADDGTILEDNTTWDESVDITFNEE